MINLEKLKNCYHDIICECDDPEREGLHDTPARAAKAFTELTAGYHQNAKDIIKSAMFKNEWDTHEIHVGNIEFYSLCEHHLLPFYGVVNISYIPGDWILGLSKFARVVDIYARRLQIQERLTTQIGESLQDLLEPQGVRVVIEAEHLCMKMRGCEKQNTKMITSFYSGCYKNE